VSLLIALVESSERSENNIPVAVANCVGCDIAGTWFPGIGEHKIDGRAGDVVQAPRAGAGKRIEAGSRRRGVDHRIVAAVRGGKLIQVEPVAFPVDFQVLWVLGGIAVQFHAMRDTHTVVEDGPTARHSTGKTAASSNHREGRATYQQT